MHEFSRHEKHTSINEHNGASLPSSSIDEESTVSPLSQVLSSPLYATTVPKIGAPTAPFLLPGANEVVRRMWICEQDGKYIPQFFDIWRAELAGHFVYRIYEADTLKTLTYCRHPIQAEVLQLLVQTELVPSTSSIPFIVKTGSEVDRVMLLEGLKMMAL